MPYIQKIGAIALLVFLVQCKNPHSVMPKKQSSKTYFYEGVVTKSHKVVDNNSTAPLSENDSIMLNDSRAMFIYKQYLIDVILSESFNEDRFIGIDTAFCIFYDFDKQIYIKFKRLSTNVGIIERGLMTDAKWSATNPQKRYDPLYFVAETDSGIHITDTLINGINMQRVQLIPDLTANDSTTLAISKLVNFYVNPKIKGFPIQLSHSLSKKRDNGFVFRRELPFPIRNTWISSIETLDYEPKKLPDSLIKIFNILSAQ
jgi:hypothetical protein